MIEILKALIRTVVLHSKMSSVKRINKELKDISREPLTNCTAGKFHRFRGLMEYI